MASKIVTSGDLNLSGEDLTHIYIYATRINTEPFSKIIIIVQLSDPITQDDETGE